MPTVARDADSKLIISWCVGTRDAEAAHVFMDDVAARCEGRMQLTTDGHRAYLSAVEDAFGGNIDYAQLVKLYGESSDPSRRYSPAIVTGIEKMPINGSPVESEISHELHRTV